MTQEGSEVANRLLERWRSGDLDARASLLMGVSVATVENEWAVARTWLPREFGGSSGAGSPA